MTCIIGILDKNKIYFGSDSQATYENNLGKIVLKSPKIFKVKNYLVGACGSPIMMNVLMHHVKWPDPPKTNIFNFVSEQIIPLVKDGLSRRGNIYGSLPPATQILIGVSSTLVTIDTNTQQYEVKELYHAIGGGSISALGSLHTSTKIDPGMDPKKRIKLALETSAKYNCGVSKPWKILEL